MIIHAPKDGFFYVLDRKTGELISADPITKVSWASGIDSKTGKPNVNPEARYRTTAVSVMPGPSGGHVWEPWSYSPLSGLVYFPGTAGGSYIYRADPNYTPAPTDIGPTGRGRMNMGTGAGAGGGRGARVAERAARQGMRQRFPMLMFRPMLPRLKPQAVPMLPRLQPAAPPLATIGPDGTTGNVLYAWDPVARKERWRAAGGGAGAFAGGCLATAGNLVFSSVNSRLLAYRADTGDKVFDMDLGTTQMGPPISFTIDGKQVVAVTAGVAAAPGAGSRRTGRPPQLIVLSLP